MNSGPLPPEAFCQLLPAALAFGAWALTPAFIVAPLALAPVIVLAQLYGGKTQPLPVIL